MLSLVRSCSPRNPTQGQPSSWIVLVQTICGEGVDLRVSNTGGALGQGSYFAWASVYSDRYTRGGPRAVGAAAMAAGGPMPPGFPFPGAGMPPPGMPSSAGFMASMGLPSSWSALNPVSISQTKALVQRARASAASLNQTMTAAGGSRVQTGGAAPLPGVAPPSARSMRSAQASPDASAPALGRRGKGKRGRPAAASMGPGPNAMVPQPVAVTTLPPPPPMARLRKGKRRISWPPIAMQPDTSVSPAWMRDVSEARGQEVHHLQLVQGQAGWRQACTLGLPSGPMC